MSETRKILLTDWQRGAAIGFLLVGRRSTELPLDQSKEQQSKGAN